MRITLAVLALLLFARNASAQATGPDPLDELQTQLRSSADPYSRAEHARVVGWIRDATERVEREAAGPCRELAETRLQALVRRLGADPTAAPRAWEATRRITLGLAECGTTGEPAAAHLEIGAWLRVRDPGSFVSGAALAGPRARTASGHEQLAQNEPERALASFTQAQALLRGIDDPVLAADVARGIGEARSRLAQPRPARASLEEAIRIATGAGARGRRVESDAWLRLGYVHAGEGRYDDALAAYDRALALRAALVGADDPWTADIENARAVAFGQLRRYAEGIAANRRVLAVRRRVLGDGHPDTLISRSNIAVLLQGSGDTAGALEALREVLAERERWLGPNDPGIAVTLTSLARIEASSGSPQAAEALLRRAIAIREQLPERHADRGRSHTDLAALFVQQGRFADAVPMAERALELMRAARGEVHPEVAAAWALVARCAERAGLAERAAEARAASARSQPTPMRNR